MSDAYLEERDRLWGLAYRMVGSGADADDVVQECWLRWQRTDQSTVDRPAAWLTTVTSRLALDRLRARRASTVDYVGPWLPEPISIVPDPAELADSLSLGFMVLLERLEPIERVVLLLADVFGEPFEDIASTVGKTAAACRQIASRARRRVRDASRQRTHRASTAEHQQLVSAFLAASASGDLDAVAALLDPDVVLLSDGGAHHHAARRPVIGRHRVSRLVAGLGKRMPEGSTFRFTHLNGEPAIVAERDGQTWFAMVIHIADGAIHDLYIVINPDKLHGVRV